MLHKRDCLVQSAYLSTRGECLYTYLTHLPGDLVARHFWREYLRNGAGELVPRVKYSGPAPFLAFLRKNIATEIHGGGR